MNVPLGRDPGADRGPDGGITSPLWHGNASGSPRMKLLMLLRKGKCVALCWSYCPCDPTPDKRLKMDGWMHGTVVSLPRSGTKRKLSPTAERKLVRMIKSKPRTPKSRSAMN